MKYLGLTLKKSDLICLISIMARNWVACCTKLGENKINNIVSETDFVPSVDGSDFKWIIKKIFLNKELENAVSNLESIYRLLMFLSRVIKISKRLWWQ